MDCYVNSVTAAGHGFVYAVIHYLVEALVQSVPIGATDIHAWPQAYGLDLIQDLDIFGSIFVRCVVVHVILWGKMKCYYSISDIGGATSDPA
jgi:hypothetical protein